MTAVDTEAFVQVFVQSCIGAHVTLLLRQLALALHASPAGYRCELAGAADVPLSSADSQGQPGGQSGADSEEGAVPHRAGAPEAAHQHTAGAGGEGGGGGGGGMQNPTLALAAARESASCSPPALRCTLRCGGLLIAAVAPLDGSWRLQLHGAPAPLEGAPADAELLAPLLA
ncbi:hypothetical protein T492DRAFT_918314, partial [Pavlovales sp. CCMP2436]